MKSIKKIYIGSTLILATLLCACQESLLFPEYDLYNKNTEDITVSENQRSLEIDEQEHFMFFRFEALKFWWSADVNYKIEALSETQKNELEEMYSENGIDYFARDWYDADLDGDNRADGGLLAEIDWFSMSPMDESFGSRPVTMSITRNIEKVPRVIFIRFNPLQDNAEPIPFKLIQKAADPFIEVSDSELQVPVSFNTNILHLTTSESWKVETDNVEMFSLRDSTEQKEIDLTNNSFTKTRNRTFVLSVRTNNTGDVRTGKLVFSSLEDEKVKTELLVTQMGDKMPPTVSVENTPDEFKVKWNAVFGHKGYIINFYKVENGVSTDTRVASYKMILNKKTEQNTEFEIDVPLLVSDWSLDNGQYYIGQIEPRVSVLYLQNDDSESVESLPNEANIVHNLFDSGTGLSESDPLVIKSLRHLQNVQNATMANVGFRYYRLDANIDLKEVPFMPIGSVLSERKQCAGTTSTLRVQETGGPIYMSSGETGGFEGDFNGNGNRISNFSSNLLIPAFNGKGCPTTVALFSTVSGNSRIHDLTVSGFEFVLDDNGGSVTSGLPPSLEYYDYLLIHAPLVAILRDEAVVDNCTAENCNIRYVKNMSGSRYEKNIIGGLVGFALNNAEIKNSRTAGNGFIFANDKATIGGILGASRHLSVKVSECINGMQYIASTGCIVGGIVGRGGGTVDRCANYAVIRPSMYAGGIMGNCSVVYGTSANGGHMSTTNELQATLTVNYGNFGITGTGTNNVNNFTENNESGNTLSNGGLVGIFDKGFLKQCANYGDLDNHFYNNKGGSASTAKWGGLVGESKYSSPQLRYIDCANYGQIRFSIGNANSGAVNRTYQVGGLFGSFNAGNSSNVEVRNVLNAGSITLVENANPSVCFPTMGNYMGYLSGNTGFIAGNIFVLQNSNLNLNGSDGAWSNSQVFAKNENELKSSGIYAGWSNWSATDGQYPVINGLPVKNK